MTTPTSVPVPPVQPAPEPTTVVETGPTKMDRTKTFAKKTFTRVGVPVLIGSAAAYVAARRLSRVQEENSALELTTSTEE